MSEDYRTSSTTTQQYSDKPMAKAPKPRSAKAQSKAPKLDREAMKKDR